jgi:pimeloyl-ACP methyl ester carboxylesterase
MLNYRIEGRGPALLLLHGFGISFNIWNGLRPLLCDRFMLVEVELPGIGLSPLPPPSQPYLAAAVDALEALRDFLGFARWQVLSYSTGTRVAETYLQLHAERVERAVFLCPAHTAAVKALGLRLASVMDARLPVLGNWMLSGWRIRFLVHLLGFNLRRDPLVDAWTAEITSQPVNILKATLRSMPEGGVHPFKIPASIPALFVWGQEDLITAMPRHLSARDVVIHADHSMPQARANDVANVLLLFLR